MLVLTPTGNWLRDALSSGPKRFAVASPYVGKYLSDTVTKLSGSVQVTLLTRTLLADFASKASDLDAVTIMADRSGGVLSLSSLHAKVYVVDGRALITSANATASGMFRNHECGLEVKGLRAARELRRLIVQGFGSSRAPVPWTREDLQALREPVERLRTFLPTRIRSETEAVEAPPRLRLASRDYSQLIDTFTGWLRLTIDGVSRIDGDVFTMADVVAACAPIAATEFPDNRHVREKLRQQMQRLRDLGLVGFLGNGRYELLARRK